MAAGTKIVFTFVDSNNKNAQISYNYAKSNATQVNVLAAANAIIAKTSLFKTTYTAIKQIKTVTTSENVYQLTDERIPASLRRYVNPDAGEPLDNEDPTPTGATVTQTQTLAEGQTLSEQLRKIRAEQIA